MSTKGKVKQRLSEIEIDQIVVTQADDDMAWEKPVHVRVKSSAISIPAELAARAAFLAQLHRRADVEEWLTHIIQERIELEEAAFIGAKHDLATSSRIQGKAT